MYFGNYGLQMRSLLKCPEGVVSDNPLAVKVLARPKHKSSRQQFYSNFPLI